MFKICEKRTPKAVKRRSSRVDFRLRNPSSPDVVLVIKALFSIFDPHNRVETNMYFVFTHVFVLALRYLHFFPLLTYITDSKKFLRCLLFTDGRLQLQHSNTSTKSVKRRMLKHQRSSRVDFWWRNPSSPDVVMKALFRILEPQNRVERNTYFVFAHDFVLALRYLHFFPLLTYMTDSTKYIWRSFSRMAGHDYNVRTSPRNLWKGGFQNTGNYVLNTNYLRTKYGTVNRNTF